MTINKKVILLLFIPLFFTQVSFGQAEVFKNVVNNLAFYRQKKDLKYLANAKKSIDSLIKTHADSVDLQRNVYKAVVYSSIVYLDSLNKLKEPANFFDLTRHHLDQLMADNNLYKYRNEIDYCRHCIANIYLRQGFEYMRIYDYNNAIQTFQKARIYAPEFKNLTTYIAYANSRLGNLVDASKFYGEIVKSDTTRPEYVETAANTFKAIGDTARALKILQKGRKYWPKDKFLLLDEANIYSNRKDYSALEPLLPQLIEENPTNEGVIFVGANCYDHLNKFDKAESLYLRAIELNSSLYEPAYNLGILYFKEAITKDSDDSMKDISSAGQWLERANEISPNDVKCLQLLQMVYTKAGNQDQINRINVKLKLLTNQ
jgi:tetratricopeptide (TPR) repeat protein